MKNVKHVCFTSHDEVLFRDSKDVGAFVNLLALSSWKSDVSILADCEMSNHVHLVVMADNDNVSDFVRQLRCKYSWYFHARYDRPRFNRFGERSYFQLDVFGLNHIQSALSYVLRNPVHHGIATTPFAYPFSSANDLFPTDMGRMDHPHFGNVRECSFVRSTKSGDRIREKSRTVLLGSNEFWSTNCIVGRIGFVNENADCLCKDKLITSRQTMSALLPRNSEWPDEWVMSEDGIFLRTSFEELKQTEAFFVTPGAFHFNMSRKSDEKWLEEQKEDQNGKPPVQLSDIEPFADGQTVQEYLTNEKPFVRRCRNTDFDLCCVIDKCIVPQYNCTSVYQLTDVQKKEIQTMLVRDMKADARQTARCLALCP